MQLDEFAGREHRHIEMLSARQKMVVVGDQERARRRAASTLGIRALYLAADGQKRHREHL